MKFLSLFKIPTVVLLSAAILILSGVFIANKNHSGRKTELSSIQGSSGTPPTVVDPIKERKKWFEKIDEVGAEKAYEEFKQFYATSGFGIQHTAAHVFGRVLYDKEGINGIVICDSAFSFGCYHSFFGGALGDKGLSVVSRLDEACLKKYGPLGTGCQHGIGHGLLEYMGYNNLVKALSACKMTTQKIAIFGCTSGVFMEYNVPLTLGDGVANTEARKLNPDKPYEPCEDVPEEFQESCYHELGQWWNQVYGGDFKKIGQLCEAVKKDINREDCYLGVGNVVAPTVFYDVAKTTELCKKMPSVQGRLICRAGASWSFFASPEKRELAPKVCEGTKPYAGYSCTQKADIIKTKSIEQNI